MNVIIIGSGHVASVIGRRMLDKGHCITHLWSRNRAHAAALAAHTGASVLTDFRAGWPEPADLIFVAVSDDAYANLSTILPPTSLPLLHSGGSVPDDVLAAVSKRTGVLYPLQSIRTETTHSPELPLLISTTREEDFAFLKSFALTLSPMVTGADSATRMRYHAAAVFAANFANHLFALTADYCRKNGLDFSFLQPLLEETVLRMRTGSPAGLQTGPAIRGDQGTIEKHLLLLKNDPAMSSIYRLFTKSIMDFYS